MRGPSPFEVLADGLNLHLDARQAVVILLDDKGSLLVDVIFYGDRAERVLPPALLNLLDDFGGGHVKNFGQPAGDFSLPVPGQVGRHYRHREARYVPNKEVAPGIVDYAPGRRDRDNPKPVIIGKGPVVIAENDLEFPELDAQHQERQDDDAL